ncbi:hypothetical protein BDZ94DRAFT_1278361 [Collybia nuda]|uniref:Uncharacterized protein n=1 Tax=Collybia nuda TaxID=64659 RepID=A0A9P5XTC4_9AGAR|nr:hypothetical protein BDZ94DRAFT_1278361 [Collybia nuda]
MGIFVQRSRACSCLIYMDLVADAYLVQLSLSFGMEITYRQASRIRGSLVYGFPLNESSLMRCGEKLHPIPPDLTDLEELQEARSIQAKQIFGHLIKICHEVWPDRPDIRIGLDTKGKHHLLLALLASTKRNDQIIPQGETLEKLINAMAAEGFKKKPDWFTLT